MSIVLSLEVLVLSSPSSKSALGGHGASIGVDTLSHGGGCTRSEPDARAPKVLLLSGQPTAAAGALAGRALLVMFQAQPGVTWRG